jgi:segregation and condensation protein A
MTDARDDDDFRSSGVDAAPEAGDFDEAEALILDLDGYEGPLHLLLELARHQKVDLAKISVSALADQFLAFVAEARAQRMDLAADYLVMAAWLTYIKSRLLLPRPIQTKEELGAEELAALLRRRLAHLEQARAVAARLWAMPQLDRDVFLRGMRETVAVIREPLWEASLHDLLKTYASQRLKTHRATHRIRPRTAYPIEDARRRLVSLLESQLAAWAPLQALAPPASAGEDAPTGPSYIASLLGAALELVRDGRLDVRQAEPFAPLYLRARAHEPPAGAASGGAASADGASAAGAAS